MQLQQLDLLREYSLKFATQIFNYAKWNKQLAQLSCTNWGAHPYSHIAFQKS
jgi:hypothetical protein